VYCKLESKYKKSSKFQEVMVQDQKEISDFKWNTSFKKSKINLARQFIWFLLIVSDSTMFATINLWVLAIFRSNEVPKIFISDYFLFFFILSVQFVIDCYNLHPKFFLMHMH
jgi:hypothetical protein